MAATKMAMGAGLALSAVLAAGAVHAQSMASGAAQFNAGYGRMPGDENRGVDPSTRDANGNRVIIDGVIGFGADQSVVVSAFGAADAFAGAGAAGGPTAIGNNLVVITQGSWNTVIIDSMQINTGNITATSELNGQVVIDDD